MVELQADSAASIGAAERRELAAKVALNPQAAALGRMSLPVVWLAGCQQRVSPLPVSRPRVVVFAGDNGIASADAPVSQWPANFSRDAVQQLSEHTGPIEYLAHRAEARVRLIQAGTSAPIDSADAMDAELVAQAFDIGIKAANASANEGDDVVIPADIGAGNSTVAAAIVGRVTGTEPVAIVPYGAQVPTEQWKQQVSVVRDAMFRSRGLADEPAELIRLLGSPAFAAEVAFIAQSAARRTPVLIDGSFGAAAAVLAERLSPGTQEWVFVATSTATPAFERAVADLGHEPWLDMAVTAGQGLGALSSLPLMNSAVELIATALAD